jgi:hypothetical protein
LYEIRWVSEIEAQWFCFFRDVIAGELAAGFATDLQQYGLALRGTRRFLSMGRENVRQMAIAALLVFTLEVMNRDVKKAVLNIQGSLEMINCEMAQCWQPVQQYRARCIG